MSTLSNGTTKIAYCQCGKKAISACVMPYAEKDKDIKKDFSNLAKEGRKIEIITNQKFKEIGMCNEKNCTNCEFSENKVSEKTHLLFS